VRVLPPGCFKTDLTPLVAGDFGLPTGRQHDKQHRDPVCSWMVDGIQLAKELAEHFG
jgi:hypothetical protein